MLQINGTLQLIPAGVTMEAGTLRASEDQPSQPAVIQTIHTLSGPVQIIWPTENIPELIQGLQNVAEESKQETPPTDLYIAGSMSEADNLARAQEELKKEVT